MSTMQTMNIGSKLYVMCGPACVVPGTPVAENRVKYVYQKTEYMETYHHVDTFVFSTRQVHLFEPVGASTPCMLSLPPPFNETLRLGSTLLFQVDAALDFVALWNECCTNAVTWQHSHCRPKKVTDPSEKLGLPPKLNEFLREQVGRHGCEVPVNSDASEEDAPVQQESETSDRSSDSSDDQSEEERSEDYYTSLDEDDGEDLEEEEEIEDEQEPEELLEEDE